MTNDGDGIDYDALWRDIDKALDPPQVLPIPPLPSIIGEPVIVSRYVPFRYSRRWCRRRLRALGFAW